MHQTKQVIIIIPYRSMDEMEKMWQTRLLIDHGAALNQKNKWGETILHSAVKYNRSAKFIKILIKNNGIDVNAQNTITGHTALHIAVMWNLNSKSMQTLVNSGIDVDIKSSTGQTAIDYAMRSKLHIMQKVMDTRNDLLVKGFTREMDIPVDIENLIIKWVYPNYKNVQKQ